MSSENPEENNNLSDIFEKCLALVETIENSPLSSNTSEFQNQVKEGIQLCEDATNMVNSLSLFSNNEQFEDIPTADIKYLLLPALLGRFNYQLQTKDKPALLNIVKAYFKDFLERCQSYSIPGIHVQVTSTDGQLLRTQKIEEYRRLKTLNEKEAEMKEGLKKKHVEEEVIREYYHVLLQIWSIKVNQEMRASEEEINLLQRFKDKKLEKFDLPKPIPPPKLKPFIITKSQAQKEVFGAGYPSLPIYSIEDWYKIRFENSKDLERTGTPQRPAEKDKDADETPESLAYDRAFDDWKDTNRRGCGNRHNRS